MREGGREGGREEGRKGGREEGRKGGREEGRKGGREEGRKGGRGGNSSSSAVPRDEDDIFQWSVMCPEVNQEPDS